MDSDTLGWQCGDYAFGLCYIDNQYKVMGIALDEPSEYGGNCHKLSNVVCGSVICVYCEYFKSLNSNYTKEVTQLTNMHSGAILMNWYFFKVSDDPVETPCIHIRIDD